MMRKLLIMWIAIVAPLGCANMQSDPDFRYARNEMPPSEVPEQIGLHAAQPVLQVTFEASDSGYRVTEMRRINGVPTESITADREVALVALDASGEPVAQLSVDNPREVHTAGASKPDRAVLDKAYLTVAFPSPERIRRISVKVLNGANAKLDRVFDVKSGARARE
jgi:hypothetical protein